MDEIQRLRRELTRLDKEKKVMKEIWSGITVNNCWEQLLVNAPSSIDSFSKLTVLAVTNASHITASLPSTMSFSEFRQPNGKSKPLKLHIVQAVKEAITAHESGQNIMNNISQEIGKIPAAIHHVLGLLDEGSSEKVKVELPIGIQQLQHIVERSAAASFTLEAQFEKTNETIATLSSDIGRSGFMLLEEVKQFWSSVLGFYEEIRKLIEYTLDSSCNAFISLANAELKTADKRSKFILKPKHREELYRASLSTVAYALSVRHLADAYTRYSSKIILPQLLSISRYPLVAHSEIEMERAKRQFKEWNSECKNEMQRTLKTNRAVNKRKSILELDLGLDVHLSDMAAELDKFLTPIADFRQGSSGKTFDKKAEKKNSETLQLPSSAKSEGVFDRLKISMTRKNRTVA